ncbi:MULTISPECIES: plasmid pRiA4b ORF-3 family protein [Mesorhizobium]|uniref:plasmid pRiA4b ORF-3 family protein n=1 Tax=Mesorhizobium TaxID=68287 RepID=UPI001FDFDF1A|nr:MULTISPECIES: plasmid pRiA4b ORF-3 family protein [Mesorhizobium]
MVWRRVQVSSTMTLREFHGVLQVAMGWEGIHLSSLSYTRCGTPLETRWASLVPYAAAAKPAIVVVAAHAYG